MEKFFNVLLKICIAVLFLWGIFGFIYDYLIWDKSVVPDELFNTVFAIGYSTLAIIAICAIYFKIKNKKSRK